MFVHSSDITSDVSLIISLMEIFDGVCQFSKVHVNVNAPTLYLHATSELPLALYQVVSITNYNYKCSPSEMYNMYTSVVQAFLMPYLFFLLPSTSLLIKFIAYETR